MQTDNDNKPKDNHNHNQPVASSCRDCVFARYEMNKLREPPILEQTECEIGKLPQNPLELYDDKSEFYGSESVCTYKRSQEWKDKYKNWEDQLKLEHSLFYKAIIGIDSNTQGGPIHALQETIDSIMSQKIKPVFIAVINHQQTARPPIIEALKKTGIEWKLENPIDPKARIIKSVDNIIKFTKPCPWYLTIMAGQTLPNNLTELLEKEIFDNKLEFGYMIHDTFNFIPYMIHKALNGSFEEHLFDKVEEINEKLIVEANEVLPCLS